jgi:hypothetical protein
VTLVSVDSLSRGIFSMRRPPIVANTQQFQANVVELWGKITVSTNVPDLEDMEVGEVRILDTEAGVAGDYKLYVKPSLDYIVSFSGDALIS